MNRNITLSLPAELIKEAKVYAAQNDKTINAVVKELLEETISQKSRTRAAAQRILAIATRGPHSKVDPGSIRREELHERR